MACLSDCHFFCFPASSIASKLRQFRVQHCCSVSFLLLYWVPLSSGFKSRHCLSARYFPSVPSQSTALSSEQIDGTDFSNHGVSSRDSPPAGAADYLDCFEPYANKSKEAALFEVHPQPSCLGHSGFASVPCLHPWSFGHCPSFYAAHHSVIQDPSNNHQGRRNPQALGRIPSGAGESRLSTSYLYRQWNQRRRRC